MSKRQTFIASETILSKKISCCILGESNQHAFDGKLRSVTVLFFSFRLKAEIKHPNSTASGALELQKSTILTFSIFGQSPKVFILAEIMTKISPFWLVPTLKFSLWIMVTSSRRTILLSVTYGSGLNFEVLPNFPTRASELSFCRWEYSMARNRTPKLCLNRVEEDPPHQKAQFLGVGLF